MQDSVLMSNRLPVVRGTFLHRSILQSPIAMNNTFQGLVCLSAQLLDVRIRPDHAKTKPTYPRDDNDVTIFALPHIWEHSFDNIHICKEIDFKNLVHQAYGAATLCQLFHSTDDSYTIFVSNVVFLL